MNFLKENCHVEFEKNWHVKFERFFLENKFLQTTDRPFWVNCLHSTVANLIGSSHPFSTPWKSVFLIERSFSIGSWRTEIPFASSWCRKFSTEPNLAQMTARLSILSAPGDPIRDAMAVSAKAIFIFWWVAICCDWWWDRWAIIFTSSMQILYVFNDVLAPPFLLPYSKTVQWNLIQMNFLVTMFTIPKNVTGNSVLNIKLVF